MCLIGVAKLKRKIRIKIIILKNAGNDFFFLYGQRLMQSTQQVLAKHATNPLEALDLTLQWSIVLILMYLTFRISMSLYPMIIFTKSRAGQ
jgi:hypothetical protein